MLYPSTYYMCMRADPAYKLDVSKFDTTEGGGERSRELGENGEGRGG